MKYTVIFTHNPQDFFEGSEPDDLFEIKITDNIERDTIMMILNQIKEGYKAIILGGDNTG